MLTAFGKLCRKIRIDYNEFLADMADKIGVSPSLLSAVENGKKNVPVKWLPIIAQAYELDENEVAELEEAAKKSVRSIKISMNEMDEDNKNLVLLFAQKRDELSREQQRQILAVLCQ